MARIKRAVNAKKKRRTVLNRAKGYYGAKSRSYTAAKEQVQHSLQYQYRDRRNKKREIRRLWITRINAIFWETVPVFPGIFPASIDVAPYSPSALANASTVPESTPGPADGMTTFQKIFHSGIPSVCAA